MNISLYKSNKYINHVLLYPILLGGGANLGPYWSPPAIPIPGVEGENKLRKNTLFNEFLLFQ